MSLLFFKVLQDFRLDFKIQTPYYGLQGQIAGFTKLRPTGHVQCASCFVGIQPRQLIYVLSMAAFMRELNS